MSYKCDQLNAPGRRLFHFLINIIISDHDSHTRRSHYCAAHKLSEVLISVLLLSPSSFSVITRRWGRNPQLSIMVFIKTGRGGILVSYFILRVRFIKEPTPFTDVIVASLLLESCFVVFHLFTLANLRACEEVRLNFTTWASEDTYWMIVDIVLTYWVQSLVYCWPFFFFFEQRHTLPNKKMTEKG